MPVSPRFLEHFEQIRKSTSPAKPLLDGAELLTYGELFKRLVRFGSLFDRLGLQIGDRAVIISRQDKAVTELFLGMLHTGITAVVVDPGSTPTELTVLVRAAQAAAVFVDRDIVETCKVANMELVAPNMVTIDKSQEKNRSLFSKLRGSKDSKGSDCNVYPQNVDKMEKAPQRHGEIDESVTGLIVFTSGTTSQPKGVELSRRSLYAQLNTFLHQYGYDAESRILNHLPLHHMDGLFHGIAIAFFSGGTVYRPHRFILTELPEYMHAISRERITHVVTVPTVLALMLRLGSEYSQTFNTPQFRFVSSTAGMLEEKLWRDFEAKFDVMVVNSYGLTETVCEAIYSGPTPETRTVGAIGKPVDCEARLVDDLGRDVPQGEIGELVLKGDNIMTGYLGQPDATAEVLKNQWFHTGDLATVDEHGTFRITGRKKTLIIRGGINVYPEETTREILRLAGVLDAVTFGVPDELWGERVVSCVTLDGSVALTSEDVVAYCREHLGDERIPNEIHILDELPRGPAGKVVLEAVKQMVEDKTREATAAGSDLWSEVYRLASTVFNVPASELTPGSNPNNTPGWDSFAHVTFLMEVESCFGIELSPRDVMNAQSLKDAVAIIERKKQAA